MGLDTRRWAPARASFESDLCWTASAGKAASGSLRLAILLVSLGKVSGNHPLPVFLGLAESLEFRPFLLRVLCLARSLSANAFVHRYGASRKPLFKEARSFQS
jgi:hypothetical protein